MFLLLAIRAAAHAGLISLEGADGPMWGYEASKYWNSGTANWYSCGNDQYFPGHYDRENAWFWRQQLSGEEVAHMKQLDKLKNNPTPGIPLEDKCNGSTPTDDPNKSIPNPWEMPYSWTTGMWNWQGRSWAPQRKAGFCPGEVVEWKHKIIADHNGVDAMIVIMDETDLPAGAQAKRTPDDFGYFVTDWRYLAHDYVDRPEGRTKYLTKDGQEIDTSICRAKYWEMGPGVYTMADGKPWDPTWPHCSDDIYRVSYFKMPQWLEHGKRYTFQWQWYSGTALNDQGEMTQPRFTTHEAEGAYFSTCVEINIRSADECGGDSGSCDMDAICRLHGVDSSCGSRVNWVMQNYGWERSRAVNLVASECDVCKSCATTAAPTSTSTTSTTMTSTSTSTTTSTSTSNSTTSTTASPDECPYDTPCWHAGYNTPCGGRIEWLMQNMGMGRNDAGSRVEAECAVCKGCGAATTQTTTRGHTIPDALQQLNQRCGLEFGDCNPELACRGDSLKLCVKPDDAGTSLARQFHERCSAEQPCSTYGLRCQHFEDSYSQCVIDEHSHRNLIV